eukprot:867631_1
MAACIADPNTVLVVLAQYIQPELLFSGLFLNVEALYGWARWMSYFMVTYFAFGAVVLNEFVAEGEKLAKPYEIVLKSRGFLDRTFTESKLLDIAISYALGILMVVGAWAVMCYKSRVKFVIPKKSKGKLMAVNVAYVGYT